MEIQSLIMTSRVIKYLSGLLFLANVIFSCSPQKESTFEEKVRHSVEEFFFKELDDPTTYEFVEIDKVDTVTYKEAVEMGIKIFSIYLKNKEKRIADAKELEKTAKAILKYRPNDRDAKAAIEDVKQTLNQIESYQSKVDSLSSLLNSSEKERIEFIELFFKFRANNSQGIKNLYHYYVKLNEDLTVRSVSKQEK